MIESLVYLVLIWFVICVACCMILAWLLDNDDGPNNDDDPHDGPWILRFPSPSPALRRRLA